MVSVLAHTVECNADIHGNVAPLAVLARSITGSGHLHVFANGRDRSARGGNGDLGGGIWQRQRGLVARRCQGPTGLEGPR